MPNRILKESICTSDDIDSLTAFQEVMFYRLIVNCDDYGLFDGRLLILKAKLFPLKDISLEEIAENLNALVEKGLVFPYEVDGKPYLKIKTWDKHQQTRSQKSKYPAPNPEEASDINGNQDNAPEKSSDINGNQLKSNDIKCHRNPIQNESESIKRVRDERFDRFWSAYPKKVGKGAAERAFAKYKPDDDLTDRMIRAVEQAKRSDQWRKDGGQFIPNPATWLNQKRWEDEVPDSQMRTPADDRGLEDWGVWTQ